MTYDRTRGPVCRLVDIPRVKVVLDPFLTLLYFSKVVQSLLLAVSVWASRALTCTAVHVPSQLVNFDDEVAEAASFCSFCFLFAPIIIFPFFVDLLQRPYYASTYNRGRLHCLDHLPTTLCFLPKVPFLALYLNALMVVDLDLRFFRGELFSMGLTGEVGRNDL